MLDWSLLQSLLIIAIACSSVTVVFIQKTKKFCRSSRCITNYGLIVNMILGFCFAQSFSNISYMMSLWVGLFSFLGADTIYRNLEGKISSYKDLIGKSNTSTTIDTTEIVGEITYE